MLSKIKEELSHISVTMGRMLYARPRVSRDKGLTGPEGGGAVTSYSTTVSHQFLGGGF